MERREARRKSSAGTVKRFASTSRCSSNGQSSSSPTGSAVSLSRVAQTHSASSEQLAVAQTWCGSGPRQNLPAVQEGV